MVLMCVSGADAQTGSVVQHRYDDLWDAMLPVELQLVAPLAHDFHRTQMTYPGMLAGAKRREIGVAAKAGNRPFFSMDDVSLYARGKTFGSWTGLRVHDIDYHRTSEAYVRERTHDDGGVLDSISESGHHWSAGIEGWRAMNLRFPRLVGVAVWASVNQQVQEERAQEVGVTTGVVLQRDHDTDERRDVQWGVNLPLRTSRGGHVVFGVVYFARTQQSDWHRIVYSEHEPRVPQYEYEHARRERDATLTINATWLPRAQKDHTLGFGLGAGVAWASQHEINDDDPVSESTRDDQTGGVSVCSFWGRNAVFGPMTLSFGYALHGSIGESPTLALERQGVLKWGVGGRVPLLIDLTFSRFSLYSALTVRVDARQERLQYEHEDTVYTDVSARLAATPLMFAFRPSDKSRISFAPSFESGGVWLWRLEFFRTLGGRREEEEGGEGKRSGQG